MTSDFVVEARARLDEADRRPRSSSLVERATEHDGMRPLSEHVWLHLQGGRRRARAAPHRPGRRRPASSATPTSTSPTPVDGASAELAVDPAERRHGLGRQLIDELIAQLARRPPAAVGARRAGRRRRARRRAWASPAPGCCGRCAAPSTHRCPGRCCPPGVDLRPFRRRASTRTRGSPSTRAPSRACPTRAAGARPTSTLRIREPWFSAAGFLMAWRGDAAGRLPLDEGPRRQHVRHRATSTTRSARSTSSASTRTSAATASAGR